MKATIRSSLVFLLAHSLGAGFAAPADSEARSEKVRVPSRGASLEATLHLPSGGGPFPGMVLVTGESATHDRYGVIADRFVAGGVAVLTYDTSGEDNTDRVRGSADDAGEGLELLAAHAQGGLEFLARREEIDPEKIGLWSFGRGGWVAPIAALRWRRAAFMIFVSAPTVASGEVAEYRNLSATDGLSEAEIARRLEESRHDGFDPAPYLRRISSPGLWLFAGRDPGLPVSRCVAVIERMVEENERRYTVEVLKKAKLDLAAASTRQLKWLQGVLAGPDSKGAEARRQQP